MTEQMITLLDPNGQQVSGPASVAGPLLDAGYKVATTENIREAALQRQYGEGLGNELKAAGLGAASGATFGLSDVALRAAGADPEAMRQLQARNPVAYGAGTAAGVLGSAAVLPGGGLVGAVGRAGEAATEGGAALARAAAAQAGGTAAKVLGYAGDVGAHALGSAVEGAVYGLGQTVTEAALGDPELNGEKLLSNVGLGALIGGSLGGVGRLVGTAARAAAGSGLGELAGEKVAELAGVPKGALQAYLDNPDAVNNARSLHEIGQGFIDHIQSVRGELSGSSGEAYRMLAESGKAVDPAYFKQPLLDQAKRLEDLGVFGSESKRAIADFRSLAADVDANAKIPGSPLKNGLTEFLGSEAPSAAGTISTEVGLDRGKKLVTVLRDKAEDLAARPGADTQIVKSYRDAATAIDEQLKTAVPEYAKHMEQLAAETKDYTGLADKFRSDNGAENLLKRIMTGKDKFAAEALQRYDARFDTTFGEDLKNSWARTAFERETTNGSRKVMAGYAAGHALAGPIGGALGAGAGFLADKYGTHAVKAALDAARGVQDLVSVEGLVNKATNAIGAGAKAAAVGAAKSAASPTMSTDEYTDLAQHLRHLAGTPEALVQGVTSATQSVHNVAPHTAQALNVAAARAVTFLQAKLPQTPPTLPGDRTPPPSKAEISRFARYRNTVENPVAVLANVADGTLSHEQLETLQTVYPKLYAHMQERVLEQLKEPGAAPYHSKVALSRFLQMPLTRGVTPAALSQMQQVSQVASRPQPAPAPKPGKLTLASRLQTDQQASNNRRGT